MAKRDRDRDRPTPRAVEAPEFPKPLVRLRRAAGGYEADVKMAADAEAEAAAVAEGFQVVAVPTQDLGFVEYPKWLFHEDGRRKVVHTAEEADALEGFTEVPPTQDPAPKDAGVPMPIGDAVGTASPNRPPVPADRG